MISHAPHPKTSYLFIDAGCLRAAIERISERYFGVKDAVTVQYGMLRNSFTKAFYYDAVPAKGHDEEEHVWLSRIEPQMNAINAIKSADGFHAQTGDLRGKKARQKKVDVQIAVDMLLHTVRQNMEQCTLLAGDVDFQPLLEALIREGMYVTLWHPEHAAADLVNAADSVRPLNVMSLRAALFDREGQMLVPECYNDIRPTGRSQPVISWMAGSHQVEVSRLSNKWLVEIYDPAGAAMSSRVMHSDIRIALSAAEDYWQIKAPSDAFALRL